MKLSAVAPAVKVAGVVPTQLPVTLPPRADMLTRVSVKAAPVSALVFELVSVKVTTDVPPDWILVGKKALAMVGGAMTVKLGVLDGEPAVAVWVVVTPLVWFG